MDRLVKPTPKHIFLFAGLTGLGTALVVYFSWPIADLNTLLENLTFVVAIGAGWATILGDLTMFIESYIDARNARLLEKGRQEGRQEERQAIADKFRSLISATEGATISKEEALRLLDEDDHK